MLYHQLRMKREKDPDAELTAQYFKQFGFNDQVLFLPINLYFRTCHFHVKIARFSRSLLNVFLDLKNLRFKLVLNARNNNVR